MTCKPEKTLTHGQVLAATATSALAKDGCPGARSGGPSLEAGSSISVGLHLRSEPRGRARADALCVPCWHQPGGETSSIFQLTASRVQATLILRS